MIGILRSSSAQLQLKPPQKMLSPFFLASEAGRPLLLAVLLFLFAAVANAQSPVSFIANPLVPDTVTPGSQAFTLTVNGANFTSSSVVNWNGTALPTTFVSATQLQAAVPASNVATPGSANISVAITGAAESNVANFEIGPVRSAIGMVTSTVNTGANPTGVAFGDFDGNGTTDMAICNNMDNTVLVYLGNGDGTFQAPVSYPVAHNPIDIAVGDVNNDGIMDIVTVSQFSSRISVLLGVGNGTFTPGQTYITGGLPQAMVMGDFNRDGNLDVATANYKDNTVSVLLGNGKGAFGAHVDYPVGNMPLDVSTADVNGDGILDLVAVNNGDSTLSVLLGNGDGTFQAQQVVSGILGPNSVGIGDLNQDGHPDLVTSNSGSSFSVFLNSGTGTFPSHTDYHSCLYPSYAVGIADLKNSGKVAVTVPNFTCNEATAAFGKGDGTFFPTPAYFNVGPNGTPANPDALGIVDLNRDGFLDMVVLNESANTATVLVQAQAAQPQVSPPYLSFGYQEVGGSYPAKTVTISNTTGASLGINSITIGGANPSFFSIPQGGDTCPATLTARASCTVSVLFAPQAIAGYVANLLINTSAGLQAFQMNGLGKVDFSLSTDFITFPPTQVGQMSAPVQVTMTNLSSVPIVISAIGIGGEDVNDWSETNTCGALPATLPPYGSCNYEITFAPTNYGYRAGTLLIYTNCSTPKRAVALRGTGYAITFSPPSLNFGNVTVGQQSTMSITFSNSAPESIPVNYITYQGSNPPNTFSGTQNCKPAFPANGSCQFNITFSPQQAGTFSVTLIVGDPDPSSPQQVPITGTGVTQATKR